MSSMAKKKRVDDRMAASLIGLVHADTVMHIPALLEGDKLSSTLTQLHPD